MWKSLTMAINRYYIKHLKNFFKQNRQNSILTLGVQNVHGYKHQNIFFKSLGFKKIESLDISNKEKPTWLADLNIGLEDKDIGKFDVVLDAGTIEHCFNISSAFSNIIKLVKTRGFVVHICPVNNWINHGFYQISPKTLRQFYQANYFKFIEEKFYGEKTVLFIAQKTVDIECIKFPYNIGV